MSKKFYTNSIIILSAFSLYLTIFNENSFFSLYLTFISFTALIVLFAFKFSKK